MERHELMSLDSIDLRALVERLMRNEADLARRLADRSKALGGGEEPMADPVYHRLHFVRRSMAEQRALAARELASRRPPTTRPPLKPPAPLVARTDETGRAQAGEDAGREAQRLPSPPAGRVAQPARTARGSMGAVI